MKEKETVPWILRRRSLMEKNLAERLKYLHAVSNRIIAKCKTEHRDQICFQSYLGPHQEDTDEAVFLPFSQMVAFWTQSHFQAVGDDIAQQLNKAEYVSDLDLRVLNHDSKTEELEFDPELKVCISGKGVNIPEGKSRIAIKTADVKSMASALPKLERLKEATWAAQMPKGRYITDWNRAMYIAEDPFVLALALEMLDSYPGVEILRINNKLQDEELLKAHPDWCTNILVNFRLRVPDPMNDGEKVWQVCECQFIFQDFFVADGVQHQQFEVTRRSNYEDILWKPIFDH